MAPSSSSSSIPKPFFENNELVARSWKIVGELGSGGCGIVYEVENTSNGTHAAMKAETIDANQKYSETLSAEALVLRRMQWSSHFCRLYLAGRLSPDCNIIVMSLVGRPLSWLRRQNPSQRFTLSTALRVGIQCLEAIKNLHSIGIIHRDVKGSNFAVGQNELSRVVHMIDFGFARFYLSNGKNGVYHRHPRRKAPYLGTDRYCSIHVHMRREQGRRDDLWSFLYMLIEFITGSLPWRSTSYKDLLKMKCRCEEHLLKKCPQEFYKIFDHIRYLNYADRPNYDLIQTIIHDICIKKNIADNDSFDWEEGGMYRNEYLRSMRKAAEKVCMKQKANAEAATTATTTADAETEEVNLTEVEATETTEEKSSISVEKEEPLAIADHQTDVTTSYGTSASDEQQQTVLDEKANSKISHFDQLNNTSVLDRSDKSTEKKEKTAWSWKKGWMNFDRKCNHNDPIQNAAGKSTTISDQ